MATSDQRSYQAAHVASAPSAVIDANLPQDSKSWVSMNATLESTVAEERPSTNFQLAFWCDAKKKYHAIDPITGAPPEEYVLVVGSLALSLTFLFGRNYVLKDRTPDLWELADDLKTSDTKLYDRLMDLANFFTSNLRHVNSRRVEEALLALDYANVKEWMKTSQEIWLWYFKWYYAKHGDGKVPEEQYKEFQESF